jgi:creatinine amidohydrolase
MQWEHLTSSEFETAVCESGVCVIAMGVIEKHSEHMPMGTDYLSGHRIACLAAEKEPAVVFPAFYFGQIYEARCFPGTLTIKPTLLIELIQGVFDEIGRNGFRKIVVYNAHGGNNALLPFLAQCSLWEERPYHLYIPTSHMSPEDEKAWQAMSEAPYGGHACERETSMVLGTHPELVKMERVPQLPAKPLERLKHLPPTYNGIWWYSDYPDHYAGDARTASREKGQALVRMMVDHLARYIAAVKADQVIPSLTDEFFRRVEQVGQ